MSDATYNPSDLEYYERQRVPTLNAKLAAPDMRPRLDVLQARADQTFQAAQVVMPPPEADDTLDRYRVRLANALQSSLPKQHRLEIPAWMVKEPQALERLENNVVDAAMKVAHESPELRPVRFVDESGRKVTEFFGRKDSWMRNFKALPLTNEDGSILSVDGDPRYFAPTGM
jgi:hypothetical protein